MNYMRGIHRNVLTIKWTQKRDRHERVSSSPSLDTPDVHPMFGTPLQYEMPLQDAAEFFDFEDRLKKDEAVAIHVVIFSPLLL